MNKDNMSNEQKSIVEKYENELQKEMENSTIFDYSALDEAPENLKRKKSAYVKLLCFLLCFALVITGSIFAVVELWPVQDENVITDSNTEKTTNLASGMNVKLSKMKNADKNAISNIKQIRITNETDNYTVVPYKDSDGAVLYKLKGVNSDIPMNTDSITSFATNVFEINSVKKIDSKYTQEDCGLNDPKISVEVTLANNQKFSFKIGNVVPDGSGNHYVSTSLAKGIYIVQSVYDNFKLKFKDLISTSIVTALEADSNNDSYYSSNSLVRFEDIKISGKNFNNSVDLDYTQSDEEALIYRISSPVKTYADDTKISTILSPFNDGLSATDIYAVSPTAKQIKSYGLEKPFLEVKYTIKKVDYDIKFSKTGVKDTGYVACMINDVPVIYMLSTDSVEFYDWDLNDIRYNMLYVRNIDTLKSLTAEYNGKKYKYNLSFDTVTSTQSSSTDETTSENEEELTVIMNNQPIDADNFKVLYQRIIITSASKYLGVGNTVPSGKPSITLTFEHNNGSKKEVITYTKYNENYYRFALNGIGDELISARKVDVLISNFERLRKGEQVVSPNEQQ